MNTYNGWTNYETWNVMLWLNNTESLYFAMLYIVNDYDKQITYKDLIAILNLTDEQTGDGVCFISNNLDYMALTEAIQEIA